MTLLTLHENTCDRASQKWFLFSSLPLHPTSVTEKKHHPTSVTSRLSRYFRLLILCNAVYHLHSVPLPPTTVTAQMLSSTAITVTWSPSNTTFLRGILRGYRVIFTPRGSVFPNIPSNVTTSVDTLSTVLTGLQEFTEYDITVAGFTIGDGNQSEPVVAKTDSARKEMICI